MVWLHERRGWPALRWEIAHLATPLAAVRHRQGRLLGRMEALGFELREEALLRTLTEDVVRSSEIEGEHLDTAQVRSSIARRLGIEAGGLVRADRDVEGIVEMMLDATQNYTAPLTTERLQAWHASLFPAGFSGMRRLTVGRWRTDERGPMQVVSGPMGRERVHFEAPAADRLHGEMKAFLNWFEAPSPAIDPVLKAGIAHLHFVTIHPFDDGNGRIARAIADLALARAEGSAQRFYSMSSQIRRERKTYYEKLESTQRSGLDITPWLDWFLGCLQRAIEGAEELLGNVLDKARFWERHPPAGFNERQRAMLERLLEGFEGKLTSSKWAKLSKCSQDTALRDITELVERGVLVREPAGGRSTSYVLAP
ncbi:Fic family protein [Vulgatibacter sp.]|uniref:Fic family protein n=1 Tax=Vulgatibacter sp. TaxID=1971226 RepID=UPI0035652977